MFMFDVCTCFDCTCSCVNQDLIQKAAEAERGRLREERRIKRALDDKFPTADSAPDEVM